MGDCREPGLGGRLPPTPPTGGRSASPSPPAQKGECHAVSQGQWGWSASLVLRSVMALTATTTVDKLIRMAPRAGDNKKPQG